MQKENLPKLDVPVITIIKEISLISNLDLMYKIYDFFFKMGYNPAMVRRKCLTECFTNYANVIIIPECVFEDEIPMCEKVKMVRSSINDEVQKNEYNIVITESVYGAYPIENDQNGEFQFMEIVEAFSPDYVIAHILAEDYIKPKTFVRALELRIRREIDAIIISDIFFDIVKYRENGTKRYLMFSEDTVCRLSKKMSEQISTPVFCKSDIEQISKHIEDRLSSDVENCRKVSLDDK